MRGGRRRGHRLGPDPSAARRRGPARRRQASSRRSAPRSTKADDVEEAHHVPAVASRDRHGGRPDRLTARSRRAAGLRRDRQPEGRYHVAGQLPRRASRRVLARPPGDPLLRLVVRPQPVVVPGVVRPPLRARGAPNGPTGRPARVGEKTPDYLVIPDGPARVKAALPDARLVVALREPVSRAHSQWSMNMRQGSETLSFPDAIAAEEERLASVDHSKRLRGTHYLKHGYVMRGRYADHLERWFAVFDRSQIFVYRSEDLYAEPRGVVAAHPRARGRRAVVGRPAWICPTPTPDDRRDARPRPARAPRRRLRRLRRPPAGPRRPVVLPGCRLITSRSVRHVGRMASVDRSSRRLRRCATA